jgi:hypothetical protein
LDSRRAINHYFLVQIAMKTQKALFSFYIALLLASATATFAQSPPPNDDFANRIVLTGSAVVFAGSLAGATIESGETNGPIHIPFYATGTVWWTWTAPVSGTVVISLHSPSSITNSVYVYTGNTLSALTLTSGSYFAPPVGRYLRFDVTTGTTYQIQVSGPDVQPFSSSNLKTVTFLPTAARSSEPLQPTRLAVPYHITRQGRLTNGFATAFLSPVKSILHSSFMCHDQSSRKLLRNRQQCWRHYPRWFSNANGRGHQSSAAPHAIAANEFEPAVILAHWRTGALV